MTDERLTFALRGQFSVTTSSGVDVTPRGKKSIAVLAMIAETEGLKRPRRWLETHLWSDRDTTQARGSLRQTLFEIRRSLKSLSGVLQSDRMSVWLDPDRVTVVPLSEDRGWEFLEGLDIADPAFRNWLVRKRSAYSKPLEAGEESPGLPRLIRVQCGTPPGQPVQGGAIAQMIDDLVGKTVSGFIASSSCAVFENDVDLIVRCVGGDQDAPGTYVVQVIDPRRDELVHSSTLNLDAQTAAQDQGDRLARFCWDVADRALERLAWMRNSTDVLSLRAGYSQNALASVLSFDAREMPLSLTYLDDAVAQLDDGLFHALRAWALTSLIMEDVQEETAEVMEEIRDALARAEAAVPKTATVAGIAANVRAIMLEDHAGAHRLARQALRDNAHNVFALQALSVSHMRTGNTAAAYDLSKLSCTVSGHTKFEAMCNLHHALLCLRMNRPEEALATALAASRASPSYRAPRRQLIGLYAAAGQIEDATRHCRDLGQLEPGFSLERFLFDTAYPSHTLRASGVLDQAAGRVRDRLGSSGG